VNLFLITSIKFGELIFLFGLIAAMCLNTYRIYGEH
jgi:hypothetical protein